MNVLALKSLFCAYVYLLLGEYLWSPLGDEVCCLVVEVSMILYFHYIVCCCVYVFARRHKRVVSVCRLASFRGASLDTCMSGDCFVFCGFGGWDVFVVDEFVPRLVYDLCGHSCWFGELCVPLVCW